MILGKDVQEIIEGVHYFLAEALARESLSGRAECLRRGLVLQLEALTGVYPALRIQPVLPGGVGGMGGPKGAASSASLPYLPMDQPPKPTGPHITPYSSSSSGVNSSSNSSSGSSGDGLVLGGRKGGTTAPLTEEGGGGEVAQEDEMYEEFDELKDEGVEMKSDKVGGGGGGGEVKEEDEKEEEEGLYTETHEPVSFSSVIATCERHGTLGKKTKGLLRNVKSYLCVAAGGMLYLYLKETDDRQKKSIDLTGYSARSATGEDIKDTRKRDAAFEMVCPGKKTHTFIARTAKDKQEWLDAIARTIRYGKTKAPPALSAAFTAVISAASFNAPPTSVPAPPPRPPAGTPQQPLGTPGQPNKEDYTLYHDVEDEELYEVIDGEQEEAFSLPPPLPRQHHSTPAPPHQVTASPAATQLDYDPVEAQNPAVIGPPPPRPPAPARPPPPVQLPDRQAQGQGGDDTGADSDDSQIYCEIEEDMLESVRKAYSDTFGIPIGGDMGTRTPANPPQGPYKPQNPPQGPYKPPAPLQNSNAIGSLSNNAFSSLGDASHKPQLPPTPAGPPRLPPKGVPPPVSEESEYKVPQSMDSDYHVPSNNPVSVEPGRGAEISSPLPPPSSVFKVPPMQTLVPIKQKERKSSLTDEKKSTVSSFRSGDMDTQRPVKPTSGTSVRDMIARLNQKKPPEDAEDEKEEEKEKPNPVASLPKQHLRPEKPPLPVRPPNLRGESPQPPSQPQEQKKEEVESDDELYDVLNHDDEETSQQQGEWYIAKFAFVATLDQALSFGRGDEVLVYDTSGTSGWWRATLKGRSGLVPREYLKKKE